MTFTTQILVVLLIGWNFISTNQKHYEDLGRDTSSLGNFCARHSDFILRGLKWWPCETSAVFLGYHAQNWSFTFANLVAPKRAVSVSRKIFNRRSIPWFLVATTVPPVSCWPSQEGSAEVFFSKRIQVLLQNHLSGLGCSLKSTIFSSTITTKSLRVLQRYLQVWRHSPYCIGSPAAAAAPSHTAGGCWQDCGCWPDSFLCVAADLVLVVHHGFYTITWIKSTMHMDLFHNGDCFLFL